jgi:hypothetical protein
MSDQWHGGKGSKRRKEDTNKYRDAWETIWGQKKEKQPQINNLKKNK